MSSSSDEFDHYLSDNDLDFEDPSISSLLLSAAPPPPAPPVVSRSAVGNVQNGRVTVNKVPPQPLVRQQQVIQPHQPQPHPLPPQQQFQPPRPGAILRPPKPPLRRAISNNTSSNPPLPLPNNTNNLNQHLINRDDATTTTGGRGRDEPDFKRRRVSRNGEGVETFVDPNPFNQHPPNNKDSSTLQGRSKNHSTTKTVVETKKNGGGNSSEQYFSEEEDMPEINFAENAGGIGGGGGMIYSVEPSRGKTVLPRRSRIEGTGMIEEDARRGEEAEKEGKKGSDVGEGGKTKLVRRVAPSIGGSTTTETTAQSLNFEDDDRRRRAEESRVVATEVNDRSREERRELGGGGGGISEREKKELEELRNERAKLKAALEAAESLRKKVEAELTTKSGESAIIRKRLNKAEAAHAQAMKNELMERERIHQSMVKKEQEFHAQMERIRTAEAFRKLEQTSLMSSPHGSARKPTQRHLPPRGGVHMSGAGGGSATRGMMRNGGGMGVQFPGASPSIGRSRGERATSTRPLPQGSSPRRPGPGQPPSNSQSASFAGFHNSFMDSPGPAGGTNSRSKRTSNRGDSERPEREGSMAPPPFPMTAHSKQRHGQPLKGQDGSEEGKGKGKGKKRMSLVEDESFFSDGHGGGANVSVTTPDGANGDATEVSGHDSDEDWTWDWIAEERDWRGEILAAVFSHTTFGTVDTSSVLPIPEGVPGSTNASNRSTAPSTYALSRSFANTAGATARSTYRAGTARSSTASNRQNSSSSADPAPSPVAAGPVPTFHFLMNLRFPSTTPPALVSAYEAATRQLFTLLGRRLDPRLPSSSADFANPHHLHHAEFDPSSAAFLLSLNLSKSFQSLLKVSDEAGLVGPITILLSLVNHLVYLFPIFAKAVLGDSTFPSPDTTTSDHHSSASTSTTNKTEFVSILTKLISRYGKPTPPTNPNSSTTATSTVGNFERRAISFRSRRARAPRLAFEVKKKDDSDGDRVVIEDKVKRDALIKEAVGLLEGLVWRWSGEGNVASQNGQDQFIDLLKHPNAISTLLDVLQPTEILLASTRTLAMLASRPIFYRSLMAITFKNAPDVGASRLGLYERTATLLTMSPDESSLTFDLHSTLLVMSTSLMSHQDEALRVVGESKRFVSEGLLKRIHKDVERVWSWDGKYVAKRGPVREMLKRTTRRLYSTVSLLYYLLLAPHSMLSLTKFFRSPDDNPPQFLAAPAPTFSSSQFDRGPTQVVSNVATGGPGIVLTYAQDWASIALGTLAFNETVPSWAADDDEDMDFGEGGTEGEDRHEELKKFVDMRYLAQEILEESLPEELEGIGECFGFQLDEEEEGGLDNNSSGNDRLSRKRGDGGEEMEEEHGDDDQDGEEEYDKYDQSFDVGKLDEVMNDL